MNRVLIDRRWLPLNAMRAFEAVARHGSFTSAANALGVSQSALSRHVISLESLIGTQLFERRPHSLVLTSAGQHLLPAVSRAFDRIEAAIDDIRRSESPTLRTLNVQFPPTFAVQMAAQILRDFRATNGEIEINLVSPATSGLPQTDVDVAVVYSRPMVTDRVSNLLWPVHLTIACHPDVAARHAGKPLADFIRDNELIHMRIDELPRHHLWTQLKRHAGLPQLNVERGLTFDTELLTVQYALSGEGLALVDPKLFGSYFANGSLVRPFDVTLDDGFGFYLITDSEALSDPAVSFFRSWLISRLGPQAPLSSTETRRAGSRVQIVASND